MKTHLHLKDLKVSFSSKKIFVIFFFLVGLLTIPHRGVSQGWHFVNYSDCNLTVTLTCGSIVESSNTYGSTWYGYWNGPAGTHDFNSIPCNCSNPTIEIVENCNSPSTTIFTNAPISSINGAQLCCCGHTYPYCASQNSCFKVEVSGCTITFAKPPGPQYNDPNIPDVGCD